MLFKSKNVSSEEPESLKGVRNSIARTGFSGLRSPRREFSSIPEGTN
jgi:hypothetical protein